MKNFIFFAEKQKKPRPTRDKPERERVPFGSTALLRRFLVPASILIAAAVLLPSLSGCGGVSYYERTVYAMDTVIGFRVQDSSRTAEAVNECVSLIYELEDAFTRTREGGETAVINAGGAGGYGLSDRLFDVAEFSVMISQKTGGAFDFTLGALTDIWTSARENESVPDEPTVKNALLHTGYDKVTLTGNTLYKSDAELELDFGGVAKGYALDCVMEILKNAGLEYGLVSFGGNVGVFGSKPDGSLWKIAVKDPRNTSDTLGTFEISSGCVAVSGDYERYFTANGLRYHHILDPKTGYPMWNGVMSAAVWCESGMSADALSTSLFVLGQDSEELKNALGIEYEAVIVDENGLKYAENGRFTPEKQ